MRLIVEVEPYHGGWRWQVSDDWPDVADEPDPFAAGLDAPLSMAGTKLMTELLLRVAVQYHGAENLADPIYPLDGRDGHG